MHTTNFFVVEKKKSFTICFLLSVFAVHVGTDDSPAADLIYCAQIKQPELAIYFKVTIPTMVPVTVVVFHSVPSCF